MNSNNYQELHKCQKVLPIILVLYMLELRGCVCYIYVWYTITDTSLLLKNCSNFKMSVYGYKVCKTINKDSIKSKFTTSTCFLLHILKVCHSSAFQIIQNSHRSVYIKTVNYSRSILANLNNTMQTKQHATKKKKTTIQIETRFTRDYFL